MGARLISGIALALCVACADSTPPILHPTTHDVTLTFTSLRFDFDTKTYPMNQSMTGTLAVDFDTHGAAFEMSSNPPCMSSRGTMTRSGPSVTGEFHQEDYSPRLTLSGSVDSAGVISGSFECWSHYGGSPHHDTYTGTFLATPRP
jgi:hypothetical protein